MAGRWRLDGQADLELNNVELAAVHAGAAGQLPPAAERRRRPAPAFTLSTLDGALLLSGSGQWTGSQLRFRGEARAAPGAEGELDNLLNIIGRRQGALSVISIG